MRTPWLSIVIPTMGRAELWHTLDSIYWQSDTGAIEVQVVADTHGGMTEALKEAQAEVYRRGVVSRDATYRWLEHDGGLHCWGQPQRQYGMEHAAGEWIAFSADDNILVPRALNTIWRAIVEAHALVPMIFRVRTWQAGVVWRTHDVANGNIDADCFVVPNVPEKLGTWTNEYNGDFHFMYETVNLWEGRIEWREELIALARPHSGEYWFQRMKDARRSAPPRHVSV